MVFSLFLILYRFFLFYVPHVLPISQEESGPIMIPKTVLKSRLWRRFESGCGIFNLKLLCFSLHSIGHASKHDVNNRPLRALWNWGNVTGEGSRRRSLMKSVTHLKLWRRSKFCHRSEREKSSIRESRYLLRVKVRPHPKVSFCVDYGWGCCCCCWKHIIQTSPQPI